MSYLVVDVDDDTLRERLAGAPFLAPLADLSPDDRTVAYVVAEAVLAVLRDVGTPATTETRTRNHRNGYPAGIEARLVTEWTEET